MMLKLLKIQGASTYSNTNVISTCIIGKLFAVLQFMQVINKQHNGIKHEYMIHFCNCKQATYLLLTFFYQMLLDWFTFFIYFYFH